MTARPIALVLGAFAWLYGLAVAGMAVLTSAPNQLAVVGIGVTGLGTLLLYLSRRVRA